MIGSTHDFSSLWLRTDEPLFWLTGSGHETRLDTDYWYDCSKRPDSPHYVLQLTLAGAGFYERNGQRRVLPPGTAFLDRIPGEFFYGYAPESRWPYEQVFVSMSGEAAFAWGQRINRMFGHVLTLSPRGSVEALMLSIAHQRAAGTLRNRYTVSSMLYELLMTLMSELQMSKIGAVGEISRALRLIEVHAHDTQFNATSLAQMVDCSREHLSRQFTRATGVSLSGYLLEHRLQLATQRLRSNEDKLEAVAHQCGFSSANYLCRVFRRRFGVSPSDFRQQPWMVTR